MSGSKIVDWDEMAARRAAARRLGKVIVFTNGCFDILHAGHVHYLQAARAMGDQLFVGLNSDASARDLKGAGRPFNSESDRAAVLAALEAVDAVTCFDQATAEDLVALIQPDTYVKAGDYSGDPEAPSYPVEARVVASHGGRVEIVSYLAGYSSTGLIERIRSAVNR